MRSKLSYIGVIKRIIIQLIFIIICGLLTKYVIGYEAGIINLHSILWSCNAFWIKKYSTWFFNHDNAYIKFYLY